MAWWPRSARRRIWRWLSEDAIRPWPHRSWIFPRDPHFDEKAGRVLDLYEGIWQGQPARRRTITSSAPTRRPASKRVGASTAPCPRPRPAHARRARVRAQGRLGLSRRLGRPPRPHLRPLRAQDRHCPLPASGRAGHGPGALPLGRRVFWIMDNGSSHRGNRCLDRLRRDGRTLSLSTRPCTRAGSTRSRSTSRSCSARYSRPTPSPRSPNSKIA